MVNPKTICVDVRNCKRIISIGDVYYLLGYTTKVRVIDNSDHRYPDCEVLEVAPRSKFKVGDKKKISRLILYSEQRNHGKKRNKS